MASPLVIFKAGFNSLQADLNIMKLEAADPAKKGNLGRTFSKLHTAAQNLAKIETVYKAKVADLESLLDTFAFAFQDGSGVDPDVVIKQIDESVSSIAKDVFRQPAAAAAAANAAPPPAPAVKLLHPEDYEKTREADGPAPAAASNITEEQSMVDGLMGNSLTDAAVDYVIGLVSTNPHKTDVYNHLRGILLAKGFKAALTRLVRDFGRAPQPVGNGRAHNGVHAAAKPKRTAPAPAAARPPAAAREVHGDLSGYALKILRGFNGLMKKNEQGALFTLVSSELMRPLKLYMGVTAFLQLYSQYFKQLSESRVPISPEDVIAGILPASMIAEHIFACDPSLRPIGTSHIESLPTYLTDRHINVISIEEAIAKDIPAIFKAIAKDFPTSEVMQVEELIGEYRKMKEFIATLHRQVDLAFEATKKTKNANANTAAPAAAAAAPSPAAAAGAAAAAEADGKDRGAAAGTAIVKGMPTLNGLTAMKPKTVAFAGTAQTLVDQVIANANRFAPGELTFKQLSLYRLKWMLQIVMDDLDAKIATVRQAVKNVHVA